MLRQMLLNTHSPEMNTGREPVELTALSELIGKVIPGVRFWVKFDQRRDAFITAWFFTPDMRYGDTGSNYATMRRPLEMAGTSLLQVTQIFAYLLTFKPRLLLIDEPDAHLHQTSQEKLIKALEKANLDFPNTQIIISTHSPRVVRASAQTTKVVWLEDGKVKNHTAVRERIGWGALDKDIVIFSEDDNTEYLQAIVDQWPDLAHRAVIWPCFGVSSIPHGDRLSKLATRHDIKVMVHRDRDFMSNTDCEKWKEIRGYLKNNIAVWFTNGSDIESCFQSPEHISRAMDIDLEDAKKAIKYALEELNEQEVSAAFSEAYAKATQSLAGQSNPVARWEKLGKFGQATTKGKELKDPLNRGLEKVLTEIDQKRKLNNRARIYEGNSEYPICEDLRELLLAATEQAMTAD
ncbi:AAA family ATPase [Rhodobacterales bacterium HKCCA1065]|nr:AAA family ATPase [Rhodobacterales bacterium HKCCA1065]